MRDSKIARYANNLTDLCECNESPEEVKRGLWQLTAVVATHLGMSCTDLARQILNAELSMQGRKNV